ncbi:MAG: NADPH:quinone oxidoreductase family protein [Hyphomicrobium sp.]|nr:NADPH:quinone oxidoreductase family protein [Hyphomicrobium sp.]MBN9263797.1 NADPH:quinone oxidoreductase family protein [Hyphomicrobium sp.]MBN9278278.1 NADPH:quinone oxidoreductase family protein [Hyphomicrobium sp.]
MKAALCKSLEGPEAIVIEEIADPVPGPDEVVVRVRAAALNFLDTLITRGKYQFKPDLPFSPAAEIAGVVEAVGANVRDLKAGQRVCGYIAWGGAREKVAVPAKLMIPIPEGVRDAAAAGISVTYGTAMHGLKDRGGLKAGESVAVLGASGGAGLAAVEIAKLMGARVIAVASSAEKLAICREHGADELLNYATSDLKTGLRELTGGKGVDVVYDCVGGDYSEAALRSIAWGGRLLVIGFAAGAIPKIPLNLFLLKNAAAVGVFWGEMIMREPEQHRANMIEVLDWCAKGRLKPHVHATYPLARIGEAITALDKRQVTGKLIVEI